MRDDNEIVAEIFNTKQKKNETVQVFARRLKDLSVKWRISWQMGSRKDGSLKAFT